MKITKRFLSIAFSIILGVGLLAFVLLKYPVIEVISTLSNITPKLLLGYLAVSFTIMILFSIRWRLVMKSLGIDISLLEAFQYRVIDYGLSYITPSGKAGGEPIRAALLMRKGISFREGMSNVTTDKIIELSVSVVFFVSGILFLALGYPIALGLRIFMILASLFLLFLIWQFYYRILQKKPVFSSMYRAMRLHKIPFLAKYQNAVIEFEKPIIKFYTEQRKTFFIALCISILTLLCSLIEYKLLLLMLGIDAPLGMVFMVFSVVGFAFLVPVPMGLGSLEAFQIALFSVLKISSASGIGLAMITRARDMIWVLLGVSLAVYFGAFKRLLKEAFDSRYNNPLMKATVFRDGRRQSISFRLHRKKFEEGFVTLQAMKKRYFDINKPKKPDDYHTPEHNKFWNKK